MSFASYGVGSTNHLIGELFATKTQTKLLHVPYKGSAAAATDLISGEVQMAFDTVSVMLPHVQAGRLKALGVLSTQRTVQAPDLPTMAEAGVPDLVVEGWLGVGDSERLSTEHWIKWLSSHAPDEATEPNR